MPFVTDGRTFTNVFSSCLNGFFFAADSRAGGGGHEQFKEKRHQQGSPVALRHAVFPFDLQTRKARPVRVCVCVCVALHWSMFT